MGRYEALARLAKVISGQFGGALPVDAGDNQAVREITNPEIPQDDDRMFTVGDILISQFMLVDINNQWKAENEELWRNIAEAFTLSLPAPGAWSPDLSLASVIIYLGF